MNQGSLEGQREGILGCLILFNFTYAIYNYELIMFDGLINVPMQIDCKIDVFFSVVLIMILDQGMCM